MTAHTFGRLGPAAAVAAGLALLALAPARAAAADLVTDRTGGCRIEAPDGLAPQWHGACRDGLAEGRGVVRLFAAGQFRSAFFGTVAGGRWRFGVHATDTGYAAGAFEAAAPLPSEDRNTLIRAFDEAAAAAEDLAETFARAGNAASATHYRDVAARLAGQMD